MVVRIAGLMLALAIGTVMMFIHRILTKDNLMKRFVVFLLNLFGPSWGVLMIAVSFYILSPLHIVDEWIKTKDETATFKKIVRDYFTEKNALIKSEIDGLTI